MANFGDTAFPLIRGMILARLLSPNQFGIAISITMVASVAELMSELGVNQLALRYGTGRELATLHTLAMARGLGLAAAIAVIGPAIALAFDSPQALWIYAIAGLASALRGFSNLEVKARMKDYHYAPEAATVFANQSIWTLVSVSVAFWIPDYRAMVFGLVAASLGSVVVSNLMSAQCFRFGWDRQVVKEAFSYGRPLVLNGIAFSIASLGDRFLVGLKLSLESLAHYTALTSAAFLPRSAVSRFMISLFTPQFVNTTDKGEQRALADTWLITMATLGCIFGLCFVAAGHEAVALAFGSRYQVPQDLINLAALLASLRYVAVVPTAPAIAAGRTGLMLTNTLLQASGLLIAVALLYVYSSLPVLIAALFIGEGFALVWVLNRLRTFVQVSRHVLWLAPLLSVAFIAGVSLVLADRPDMSFASRCGLCAIALALNLGCMFTVLRAADLRMGSLAQRLFPRAPVRKQAA